MNLRLAIAAEDAAVAEHFGRCDKFHVYEINENKEVIRREEYANPLNGQHSGMCQLPHYVNKIKANAIIAGGMGNKAVELFLGYGIDVITSPGLKIEDALNMYLQGKLSGYSPCSGHEGDGCGN
ncbi:MAG TPA: NifB/NifX family molybdenum-iron cluster-binding protein [Ignavibacteriales bacterium]|nr:NifB/NifX family molybdenum-iron cluster-binding protein [Ignavibacteriales bacterium]